VVGPSAEEPSLHVGHPLVVAAVEHARRPFTTQAVSLKSRPGWPPKGSVGRLRLVKLRFEGFERTDALIPVLSLTTGELVEALTIDQLLATECHDAKQPSVRVSDELMQDAQDQALFALQTPVDDAEHRRFEAAALQAERFIADRVLVLERKRHALEKRIDDAELRRDRAVGSESRTDAERIITDATAQLDELNGRIDGLHRRDDERYRRTLEHLRSRRYSPPRVELLIDVDVVFT